MPGIRNNTSFNFSWKASAWFWRMLAIEVQLFLQPDSPLHKSSIIDITKGTRQAFSTFPSCTSTSASWHSAISKNSHESITLLLWSHHSSHYQLSSRHEGLAGSLIIEDIPPSAMGSRLLQNYSPNSCFQWPDGREWWTEQLCSGGFRM